jgi:hypothetical protein
LNVWEHLPADSATVAAFWCWWFSLASVLAFRQTLAAESAGDTFPGIPLNQELGSSL